MFYQQTSHDITIRVEVDYVPPEAHGHEDGRYFWAYHITLSNQGEKRVKLQTRHWTITNGLGHVDHVDGPGVVGETPALNPDESFSYSSGCPLNTPSGTMGGYYMFEDADGRALKVIIPTFSLDLPGAGRVLN